MVGAPQPPHDRGMGDAALIATTDDQLLDAAVRWCAAAGAAPVAVDTADGVRREWRTAAFVLLGQDMLADVLVAGAVRRDHVLVIARDPAAVWQQAVTVGACAVIDPFDDAAALAAVGAALDGRVEGCTVSVVGGSGGIGASTFAVALGLTGARRGLDAVLLDADPGGAGVELVLGSEGAAGLRWPDLAAVDGRVSGESLADVLPRHRGLATVSWPAAAVDVSVPPAAGAVWSAAGRAFDLVVADAPRSVERDGWSQSVLAGSVLTVVVIGEDLTAVAAARRVAARARQASPSVVAVTVTRRGGLGSSAVEEAVGIPVVGRIRPRRSLRSAVDHGRGPLRSRSLRRAAADVLDLLGLDPRPAE